MIVLNKKIYILQFLHLLDLPCWNVWRPCGFFLGCCRPAYIYTMKVWVEPQSASCTLNQRKDCYKNIWFFPFIFTWHHWKKQYCSWSDIYDTSTCALTFILCVRQPRVSVLWFWWWRGISISGLTLHYLQTTFRLKYTHTE